MKKNEEQKIQEVFYNSIESLQPVVDIVNEASITLGDPKRTLKDSPLVDVFSKMLGASGGAGMSFLALYGLGTTGLSAVGITTALATAGSIIGGGMVAGVLVLSALPVAGIALTGGLVAKNIKRKKLREIKLDLYNEVKNRLAKIKSEIDSHEGKPNKDRETLLNSLCFALTKIQSELESDLINNK